MCDGTDLGVVVADLIPNFDAGQGYLIELLEIRVVIVKDRPEFQVNQGCSFKALEDFGFLAFGIHFADKVEEFVGGKIQLPVDDVPEEQEAVVFVQG